MNKAQKKRKRYIYIHIYACVCRRGDATMSTTD